MKKMLIAVTLVLGAPLVALPATPASASGPCPSPWTYRCDVVEELRDPLCLQCPVTGIDWRELPPLDERWSHVVPGAL